VGIRSWVLYLKRVSPARSASTPSRADTTGITAFRKSYPHLRIAHGLVIAPTEKVLQLSDQDWAIPWDLAG
jgi:hypothetical protein